MGPVQFQDYVAAHKQEISSLYSTFGPDFLGTFMLAVLGIFGKLLLFTFGIAFIEDIGIAKGFSMIMTPNLQSISRAVTWAVLRFILGFVAFFSLLGAVAVMAKSIGIGLLLLSVVVLLYVALSTITTSMMYQAGLGLGLGITIAATLFEIVISYFVVFPLESSYLTADLTRLIQDEVVVKIASQTKELDVQQAKAQADLDSSNATLQALRDNIDLDRKKQIDYHKALADKMVSDQFAFMHIAQLRASGKLQEAANAYKDFQTQFPNSPLLSYAQTYCDEVNQEMAQQKAALAEQKAEEKRLKDAKEKELLQKMANGNATLSEMRTRLLGLTRDDVHAYLGTPDAEASDRWGYSKQILIDRMSGQHCGIAVEFFENHVRTVDYYNYGAPTNE